MTAYCSNLPWSAAAGGELGGGRGDAPGFARVLVYPNGGTGIAYRPSRTPDRGTGGTSLGVLRGRAPYVSSGAKRPLRDRVGKLTRIGEVICREAEGGGKRSYHVPVRCDCGCEYEVRKGDWVGRTPPSQCRSCYAGDAKAKAKAKGQPLRSFTNKGHQLARDYADEQKATGT